MINNIMFPVILFLILTNPSEFYCQLMFTSLTMPNKNSPSSSSSSSPSQQYSQSKLDYYHYAFNHLAFNDSDPVPDEQRLLSQLLRNYDPSARPVYNASDTVSVAFGIALTQLSDMVCHYIDRIDRPIIRNLIYVFNIMEIFQ